MDVAIKDKIQGPAQNEESVLRVVKCLSIEDYQKEDLKACFDKTTQL